MDPKDSTLTQAPQGSTEVQFLRSYVKALDRALDNVSDMLLDTLNHRRHELDSAEVHEGFTDTERLSKVRAVAIRTLMVLQDIRERTRRGRRNSVTGHFVIDDVKALEEASSG